MKPYPDDLVRADGFEERVASLIKRSGMYVEADNYHAVVAFLLGLDRGELLGLDQWLRVKLDGYNNVRWDSSIPALYPALNWPLQNEGDHKQAIKLLGTTLSEFFNYRREVGLTKIFYDYANWLLSKDWYEGPLQDK